MNLAYRLQAFVSLGKILRDNPEHYDSILTKVYQHNPWFTIENQRLSISNVCSLNPFDAADELNA